MSADSMETNLFGLTGKRALVVGGGQGIGEATSVALARCGAAVAVLDVAPERAETVAAQVRAIGARSTAIVGSVTDAAAVDGLVERAATELGGPLDVLVTVVGSTKYRSLLDTSVDDWDLEQQYNLRYVFQFAKAFAARLVTAGLPGSATFVASVSGITGAPRHAAYGAAKAGLMQLTKSMAVEWAPHGIRVNAVAPGSIITPRLPDTAEWRAQVERSNLPMQRRGTTAEIANAVLFLSSGMASYVTGQTLAVDGGLTAANIMSIPPKWDAERT